MPFFKVFIEYIKRYLVLGFIIKFIFFIIFSILIGIPFSVIPKPFLVKDLIDTFYNLLLVSILFIPLVDVPILVHELIKDKKKTSFLSKIEALISGMFGGMLIAVISVLLAFFIELVTYL